MTTKKFRLISALMAALMVLGSLTVVPAFAADPANLNDHVVTWFDFEGEDSATQLADKATAGTVAETLEVVGSIAADGVVIEDGVAKLPKTKNTNYLKMLATADNSDMSSKTIYVRAKLNASEHQKNGVNLLKTDTDFLRTILNTKDASMSKISINNWPLDAGVDAGKAKRFGSADANYSDWLHLAMTITYTNKTFELKVYTSNDGVEYSLAEKSYDNVESLAWNNISFGSNDAVARKKSFDIDDIRVYDKVLSLDEIKTIADDVPAAEPPKAPTVDELNENVISWYDFEGTEAEALKDKATAGATKADIELNGLAKVEDGKAVLVSDTASGTWLSLPIDADSKDLNGKSFYIRFSVAGDRPATEKEKNYTPDLFNLGFMRTFVHGGKEGFYLKNFRIYSDNAATQLATPNMTQFDFAIDEVIHAIYTFELDAQNKLTMNVYVSKDGVAYTPSTLNANGVPDVEAKQFIIAKTYNRAKDITIDEFRIYNKVLTMLDAPVVASQTVPEKEGEATVMTNQHQMLWPVIRKINIAETANGTVTSSRARTFAGQTVTLTVTPDAGYELDTLTVTGKNGYVIKLKDLGEGKYSFLMPGAIPQITATFKSTGAVAPETPDTPATPETPAEDKYAANLITWYNFEGETIEEQLADKATAGTDAVAAVLNGNVEIKDGAAYVSAATEDGYISLEADNDNMDINGKTIFLKFKVLGTEQHEKNWGPDFLKLNGVFRTFVEGSKIADSGLRIERMWFPDSKTWQLNHSSSFGFEEGQYVYAAYTFEYSESGTLKVNAYLSTDGVKYQRTTGSKDNFASLEWTSFEIGRGNTRLRDYVVDDVRIYDIVLTDADLAKIGA